MENKESNKNDKNTASRWSSTPISDKQEDFYVRLDELEEEEAYQNDAAKRSNESYGFVVKDIDENLSVDPIPYKKELVNPTIQTLNETMGDLLSAYTAYPEGKTGIVKIKASKPMNENSDFGMAINGKDIDKKWEEFRRSQKILATGKVSTSNPARRSANVETSENTYPSTDILYDDSMNHNIKKRVANGYLVTKEAIKRWIGKAAYDSIISSEAEIISTNHLDQKINELEEVTVNYNELADTIAQNYLRAKYGDFNLVEQNQEYIKLLEENIRIILNHKKQI